MNSMATKIKVIPCSGMGKVFGLITREAALKVVGEMCPTETETLCLAHIVTGDPEVKEKIEGARCITLDGCPKLCAAKNAAMAGGVVEKGFRAVDVFRAHKGALPGNATYLTDDGWLMVDELAAKVRDSVYELREGE